MVPSYDLPGGGPAYPLAAPAIRVRYRPVNQLAVLLAVFNGSPAATNGGDSQQVNASGAQFPVNRGPLVFTELQYTYPSLGGLVEPGGGAPLGHTYKLAAWFGAENVSDVRYDNTGVSLAAHSSTGLPRQHFGDYSIYAVADQVVPERTWGDFSVQACGDNPQAVMHAVRQFMWLASGVAAVRWVQTGFLPGYAPNATPRNLMGFKDSTANVNVSNPQTLDRFVWVQDEGGTWMKGGSYVVARAIRMALEHWDQMKLAFQEQTVGREKASGAPLGGSREFDAPTSRPRMRTATRSSSRPRTYGWRRP